MAGCAATSQAAGVQPPKPTAQARITPVAQTTAASTVSWARAPARQLGIDLDFYGWKGLDVAQFVNADVAYVKSLHGNSLSVSFPFFVRGLYSSTVYGNAETPTPAQLAIVANAAKAAALYFSIRPLLDEANLKRGSGRTHWAPPHPGEWFASYEKFLRPYAQMAQQLHIPELFTGVEFDKFNKSPYWPQLDTYVRRYYKGTLAYSYNWENVIPSRVNSAGVAQTLDAYPSINVPASASVATLTSGWDAYLKRASGIVLTEVGIASQDGAYIRSYRWDLGERLDPKIQSRWFSAACQAMVNEKTGGIYFWSIGIDNNFHSPPTRANPTDFIDGSGASAISACFGRLKEQ